MRIYLILLVIIVLVTGCKDKSDQLTNNQKNEVVPFTLVESKEDLLDRGKVASSKLDSMLNELGVNTGATPSVDIRVEPYFIYFDPQNNQVIAPWYDEVPDEMMVFFTELSQQTEMKDKEFFQSFFNAFFYFHEFAHWAQLQMDGTLGSNRYVSEREANEITVAYLQSTEEGIKFLDYISPQVDSIVEFLDSPVPDGASEEEYFTENYAELGLDPYAYGYFQFKFVQDVLNKRGSINLEDIVSRRN